MVKGESAQRCDSDENTGSQGDVDPAEALA